MQDEGRARPFISLNGISIRLYDRVLFERAGWEMLDNEHWGVLGPNGSGKTTLLKALCGQVPVVQGEIVYHFHEGRGFPYDQIAYASFDAQKRALGPQDLFHQARWHSETSRGGVTVAEALEGGSASRGSANRAAGSAAAASVARRDEVVEALQIDGLLDRDTVQLSSGERRKLVIAQALLRAPRLLILDSPFTGLDAASRAGLRAVIGRLTCGQMRVIVAATGREELPSGITHVLEVDDGRVLGRARRERPPCLSVAPRATSVQPISGAEGCRPGRTPRTGCAAAGGAPGQVLVHMENVHVSYNGTHVLRGVDWTVREGERWALVGPNGAGKTTLLSLILGDNPQAYANRVTLFGRSRGSGETIWEIKQQIGWMAPELHLHYPVGSTCLDVVCAGYHDSVGLYRCSEPRERDEAQVCLECLGIGSRVGALFARLSEGEQRMVLVARALVKRPRLLVLDEPCQGLDHSNRDRVLGAIELAAARLDAGLIYVTHDGVFPRAMTHAMHLQRGRVVQQGRLTGRAQGCSLSSDVSSASLRAAWSFETARQAGGQ